MFTPNYKIIHNNWIQYWNNWNKDGGKSHCLFVCFLVPRWNSVHLGLLSVLLFNVFLSLLFVFDCFRLKTWKTGLESQEKPGKSHLQEWKMPFWKTSTHEILIIISEQVVDLRVLYTLVYRFGQDHTWTRGYAQISVSNSSLKTEKPPFSGLRAKSSRRAYEGFLWAWKALPFSWSYFSLALKAGNKQSFFFIPIRL